MLEVSSLLSECDKVLRHRLISSIYVGRTLSVKCASVQTRNGEWWYGKGVKEGTFCYMIYFIFGGIIFTRNFLQIQPRH